MKYTEAREQFFHWLAPAKLSAATITAYRSDLDVIASLIGDPKKISVTDLRRDTMRRAFATYAPSRSKATIQRAHYSWSKFFSFLVADEIVEGSPMAGVPCPKLDKRSPKPLEGWEEDLTYRLLSALKSGCRGGRDPWPELDVAVMATLFAVGTRASELLALDIRSVEGRPPTQVIHIIGKGNKPRSVPIAPELDIVLGDYLSSRRERYPTWKPKGTDPLFVGAKIAPKANGGTRLTYPQLNYLIKTGLESAGFGNRRRKGAMAHAFRHTFGTVLASQGTSVVEIKNMMGHATLNTTQGYLESLAIHQREAAIRNTVYEALGKLTAADT